MAAIDAALADAPIAAPSLTGAVGRPAKCRRHPGWRLDQYADADGQSRVLNAREVCVRCGAIRNPITSRRGKNNRSRGNAIEREVAAKLGLRRVGQYGGPDDIRGAMFAGQVKSGMAFPEKLWRWLRAVPVDAGQTAILVLTDAPGPGNRRRALVVVELADWIALHGPTDLTSKNGA